MGQAVYGGWYHDQKCHRTVHSPSTREKLEFTRRLPPFCAFSCDTTRIEPSLHGGEVHTYGDVHASRARARHMCPACLGPAWLYGRRTEPDLLSTPVKVGMVDEHPFSREQWQRLGVKGAEKSACRSCETDVMGLVDPLPGERHMGALPVPPELVRLRPNSYSAENHSLSKRSVGGALSQMRSTPEGHLSCSTPFLLTGPCVHARVLARVRDCVR